METWQGELELTADIASTLGDVTPDTAANNPSLAQQKTVQFLISLYQRIQGQSPISIDGRIGNGTKGALSSIVPTYTDGVITQAHISELVSAINTAIDSKMAEQETARQAAEQAQATARATVASFNVDTDKNDREKVRALQEALNLL